MKPTLEKTRVRRLVFRLLAVLLGLAPFACVEATLRALDLGRPSRYEDPFVGFSSVRPLFVLSDDGTRYEIPRSRQTNFRPESFAAVKAPHEFRIFSIGDSTVQGNPYSIETSFTTWLEISLEAADRNRRWDVINCGGISYASYRMVPILEELLHYEPDLFIVHSSHNEFLEDRTYGHIKRTPRAIARTREFVSQLRGYALLREGYIRLVGYANETDPKDRTVLTAEVDALLDYRGGMDLYHRDEEWRQGVMSHYEINLHRMVEIAHNARVPIILLNPVSNLRDSPPFKSEHRTGLSPKELENWETLWSEARRFYNGRYSQAVPLLLEAIAMDDQHAGIHYDLAKCYDALGQLDDARREYVLAKELDICPLRILEPMNEIVLEVARKTKTPVVDVRRLFERLSPTGIPGKEWLVDHVHPSIGGHQVLADTLADELVRQGIVRPATTWREDREHKYAEHLASLDALYFAKGQQHLERLMTWAEGRVNRERPKP